MTTRTFKLRLLFAISFIAGISGVVFAGSADSRCDELLTALRDGDFGKATVHFDPTMKAALSPDALGKVWLQIVADNGKLQKWAIIQRGQINGIDVRIVELTFDHGKQISTISVRSATDEIAGLYFKPLPGAPATK